jgi:hypothetical protein
MARTAPPRKPSAPPADAAEGARRVRELLLKLFERKEGGGTDWALMLESCWRAFFQLSDIWPDKDAHHSMMRRVLEGAYKRLSGDESDDDPPGNAAAPDAAPAPTNTRILKHLTLNPRGPRR